MYKLIIHKILIISLIIISINKVNYNTITKISLIVKTMLVNNLLLNHKYLLKWKNIILLFHNITNSNKIKMNILINSNIVKDHRLIIMLQISIIQ